MSKKEELNDKKKKSIITNKPLISGLGVHIWKIPGFGNYANITTDHYMKVMPKLGCWQIFSHGPRSKKLIVQDNPNEVYLLAKKLPLYIHSSYMTSPEKDLNHIVEQLYAGRMYGAQGLIIHIPKVSIPEIVIMTINIIDAVNKNPQFAEAIKKEKEKINNTSILSLPTVPRIIWEAKAIKKCDESFETPEKWNLLAKALGDVKITPKLVGLNIDTAHIYASGANISTEQEVKEWLSKLSAECMTYMRSGLLHLNGNEYDHNDRAGDKHAIPGSPVDKIWKDQKDITKSGCSVFVDWARSNGIPIVLELKHEEHGLQNIANLANKF